MFLGSIKAPVPPSTCHPAGIARRPGQIRRLRRDRSHAQPRLWGEHGEDPQFDGAEHDAMLRPREACIRAWSRLETSTSALAREALSIEDRELIHRLLPVV